MEKYWKVKRGERQDESVEWMKRSLQHSKEQLNVPRCLRAQKKRFFSRNEGLTELCLVMASCQVHKLTGVTFMGCLAAIITVSSQTRKV